MTYKIADTHTHLYFSAFDSEQEEVIRRCDAAGVALQVQIGCDEVSTLAAIDLAKKYSHFYATVGLHPCDVKTCFSPKTEYRPAGYKNYTLQAQNFDDLFNLFDDLIQRNKDKVVGLGETGFDLYHENSEAIRHLQWDSFERHVYLAQKHSLPLVIHTRNARETLLSFLRAGHIKNTQAVIHCFSENADFAQMMTKEYGFYLGIGGVATYPKSESVRHAINMTPIQHLLTETDAPFLVPQQARKKSIQRNDGSLLPEIIRLIADIKEIDEQECAHCLFQNARVFYQL